MFPEPADAICGQQRADGDITLRTDEEVGEPEPEKSGQGEAVSRFSDIGDRSRVHKVTGAFRYVT